jgi:tricorn protease
MPVRPLALLSLLLAGAAAAQGPTKLLRFPDIHGERVVFVHAGDIHIAPSAGGTALRLTSHPGAELYPKFSPDGRQIAFSAEYDGTRQVYVMPAGGGEPRQLTFYNDIGPMPPRGGTDYRVLDWTPDGQHILVRMNRVGWDDRGGRHYLVPVSGGMEQPLPIPEGGAGMFSPDGNTLVYTPIDREFRTWKRTRGGRAQDVWTYDLAGKRSTRLTTHIGTDHQPMWLGETIYFVSDRDYTLNLYSLPVGQAEPAAAPRKLTDFRDFDVLWPSAGPGGIVFENGGSIWRFDPSSGQASELSITVPGDRPHLQPRYIKPADFVESIDLSPGGERALFGARGEVFTVPAKQGEIRNLSRSPDAREISATWSPDGKSIAYLSDESGEYELYVRAQDGSGAPRRITRDGDVWRFPPLWSPDSKKLAFADKRQRLRIVDVASGAYTEVDRGEYQDLTDYAWSPDSRWLAYVKSSANRNGSIWLYSLEAAQARQLTPDETGESNPVFDPQGRYLYFLSNRDFNLTFSAYEFDYVYTNATRIYAAPLAADGPPLFAPKSDEVGAGKEEKKDGDKPARLNVDIAGFNRRVVALKAPAGQYRGLSANAEGVFFLSGGQGPGELRFLGLEEEESKVVAPRIARYVLSADGKRLLLAQPGGRFAIVDAKPEAKFDDNRLKLDAWELQIDPRREWNQLYVDGWRILRDWFYDPGMHGQDWNAIRDRYAALLPHVSTRADLDYLFGEIAGEANAGHVYVQSGDEPRVERKPGGLLGAEIEAHASGYFRIARIYAGENWHPDFRSPLTEPGVDVREGDFILAIDGRSAREVQNVYQLLQNRADKLVVLRVNGSPSETGARTVRVRPIAQETNLRYLDWVASRRALVERLSNGRIGYIHLPNTAAEGNRELYRGLLAYRHKEALIIDDRYNGGGFIPDRMIEKLARNPLNYWATRGLKPNPTPLLAHEGPKAMLINSTSSSGGDALPYYFRKLGLGPLIGTRTWGGLIGISGNPPLADNGTILAATFRFIDTDGQWAVEDEGVAPDVEVFDLPELIAQGRDPSVETAVQVLLDQLAQRGPWREMQAPPAPTVFPRDAR